MAMPSLIPAVKTPTVGDYKGHPVITLPCPGDNSKPGIQFGLKKCKALLENLKAVEDFVKAHDKGPRIVKVEADKLNKLAIALKAAGVSDAEIAALVGAV